MGQGVSAIFDSSGFFDKGIGRGRGRGREDNDVGVYEKLENEIQKETNSIQKEEEIEREKERRREIERNRQIRKERKKERKREAQRNREAPWISNTNAYGDADQYINDIDAVLNTSAHLNIVKSMVLYRSCEEERERKRYKDRIKTWNDAIEISRIKSIALESTTWNFLRVLSICNMPDSFSESLLHSSSEPDALALACPNLQRLEIVACSGLATLTSQMLTLPSNLVDLVITHCDMVLFELELPVNTLSLLDISSNRLRSIPACLEMFENWQMVADKRVLRGIVGCPRLILNGNDFWFTEGSDISYPKVNELTLPELTRAAALGLIGSCALSKAIDHVYPERARERERGRNGGGNAVVRKVATTYDNSQSVHISSVQSGVRKVIQHLKELRATNQFNPYAIKEFSAKLNEMKRGSGSVLRVWCAEMTERHGSYQMSMTEICEAVFIAIEENIRIDEKEKETMTPEQKKEKIKDMKREAYKSIAYEIHKNKKVCFTGRITHLLGALGGLVPGFEITVSLNEEIQNTMAFIRNKWVDRLGDDLNAYLTKAVPEATQALCDLCVPEGDMWSWLDAL